MEGKKKNFGINFRINLSLLDLNIKVTDLQTIEFNYLDLL